MKAQRENFDKVAGQMEAMRLRKRLLYKQNTTMCPPCEAETSLRGWLLTVLHCISLLGVGLGQLRKAANQPDSSLS